jgi:hypothetical protein
VSEGPRDWSPPGYWDESRAAPVTMAPSRSRRTDSPRTVALVSVMLGLFRWRGRCSSSRFSLPLPVGQ